MMSNDQWLFNVLKQQELMSGEIQVLQQLRDRIQNQLQTGLTGNPRFYYAGSYAKKTMVRARYDLDIVIYWPNGTTHTLESLYESVGQVLGRHWNHLNRKTVSWEIPFNEGFHVDVVPGRALDNNYLEANLYRSDKKTSLKTSLKTHIQTVKNSGHTDVIRLMKLWREVKSVPFKKSFLLEMMVINGCKGIGADQLEQKTMKALAYIRDNILACNVLDPANSNNSLSDELTRPVREQIQQAASAAINARTWGEVFGL